MTNAYASPIVTAARALSSSEVAVLRSSLQAEALSLWARARELSGREEVDPSLSPASDALLAESLLDDLGRGARLVLVPPSETSMSMAVQR